MVENDVREEVARLRIQIVSEKVRFDTIKNWIYESKDGISFYTKSLKYHKDILDRARGTDEEEEATERIKNTKRWLEKYGEMLTKNEKDAHAAKERLKEMEDRLKELTK